MSDRLTNAAGWNRARALKLHEHFKSVALMLQRGGKLMPELERVSRMIDGLPIDGSGQILDASPGTLKREWYHWLKGGRKGEENEDHICKPEAVLCTYKAGCGGHGKMPRKLIAELQRRMTHVSGGRDKQGKAPISVAWRSIEADYQAQRPLPGVDYAGVPMGAEIPWHYSTACRNKAPRTLRALGNMGASFHKGMAAYISLDYSKLRKGELYTLDDVRLDIVVIDEATGKAQEVTLYVLMEVGSRLIVNYVMLQSAAGEKVKQEDVDELIVLGLQTPGFGIGVGYTTHILFERGSVACSDAARAMIEGVSEGSVRVHRTGMVGGVRWIGSARDKARGNAAGKAVIESFNRSLHYALLHLPGQRGNHRDNQPQSMGDLGKPSFFARPAEEKAKGRRTMSGTLIDQAEQLAQFEIVGRRRLKLKLPMLYLMELNTAVRAAIQRHNTEPGHDYRGHGSHFEAEVRPGVWREMDRGGAEAQSEFSTAPQGERSALSVAAHDYDEGAVPMTTVSEKGSDVSGPRDDASPVADATAGEARPLKFYQLRSAPAAVKPEQRNGVYWGLWKEIEAAKPGLCRFALTRRAIGVVRKVSEMTDEQFAQVIRVFTAIAREASAQPTQS